MEGTEQKKIRINLKSIINQFDTIKIYTIFTQ